MHDVHMYICIYSVNMYITCTKHRTCFRFNQQNHHVFHKTIAICDFFFNENTILMFSIRHCIELCLVLKSRNKYVLNHIKNMWFFLRIFSYLTQASGKVHCLCKYVTLCPTFTLFATQRQFHVNLYNMFCTKEHYLFHFETQNNSYLHND